jgi:hypothetical protein
VAEVEKGVEAGKKRIMKKSIMVGRKFSAIKGCFDMIK